MSELVFHENAFLRAQLNGLVTDSKRTGSPAGTGPVRVIVTMNEVNDRHGTGPLVKRILSGRDSVFSIRSRDDWGVHDFGDESVRISHQGLTRRQSYENVLAVLGGRKVHSVVCIVYLPDELKTAMAVHDLFDAPIGAYVMDDQNVATNRIPDNLMREFLGKCSIRFATHPELCDAYRRKFGFPFFNLPAVVPYQHVAQQAVDYTVPAGGMRFALLGSIWDQVWFDRLCSVFSKIGAKIDWFGNNKSPWLSFPPDQMRKAGIVPRGIVPENMLAEELKAYPFVIVPMSMLDSTDSNRGVAALSLPGRILFAAATAHTPTLILGSPETCGSRFVRHFQIGETAPYDAARVAAAISRLTDQDRQKQFRGNCAQIGARFSDLGVADWLDESIARGAPADARFEDAFHGYAESNGPLKTVE